ncbi:MAG TPA: hypothetical protein VN363_02745 [Anaerolineales bacterium]|nr:hypothetical protein [Anaerolineales bacterium]
MDSLTEWLLAGPPWVAYRTRLDLLGEAIDNPEVQQSRQAMLKHPQVQQLVAELADWPGSLLSSHKSAGHAMHKLTFLADLGLKVSDPGVEQVVERVLEHRADTGPFQMLMNISPAHGGSGKDEWAWALCDAPLLVYALVNFGLGDDPRVTAALAHLIGLITERGWPCAVSPELGKFRGPGRKDDPCSYANLVMLKTLALRSEWQSLPASRTGIETLLSLWESRSESHPYMFYMGTDFCKLKAPLVWYDILHVTDVLTRFPWLAGDPRMQSMLDIIRSKLDRNGQLVPESIWTAWKEWDFGQKKEPSRWLTVLVQRVIHRLPAFA